MWLQSEVVLNIEIEGETPREVKASDNWTLKERVHETHKTRVNGNLVLESDTAYYRTYNLTVLGHKKISVPAGTFDCIEVKKETVGISRISLKYYAPQAKAVIKKLDYEDEQLVGSLDLMNFDS